MNIEQMLYDTAVDLIKRGIRPDGAGQPPCIPKTGES